MHVLETLKWPILKKRRENARLLLLFKLVNNLLTIPTTYMPTLSPLTATRAQLNLKYRPHQEFINAHFSQELATPQWNNLCIPDLDNLTLNQFKSKL